MHVNSMFVCVYASIHLSIYLKIHDPRREKKGQQLNICDKASNTNAYTRSKDVNKFEMIHR